MLYSIRCLQGAILCVFQWHTREHVLQRCDRPPIGLIARALDPASAGILETNS